MKLYKLIVHSKGFCGEDLLLNPKDFPNLKIGDTVEIYHPEGEFSRLLLQITSFKDDFQSRDAISVEQSIATKFQLRTYADVHVHQVNPSFVALDSVEVVFKDQYMGRSEMWRLKNSMVNTCVYLKKKIEFCGGSVRCEVYEMWSQGDRVACGVIVEATKVVFRSLTSMVYLFLQMSSEMWDFDIHGDLYFEKAVNGFLADLFEKWKSYGSNHEVTIVLFSRTFYEAHSIEEFPSHMRECLQQDYKGRFYEDFYRVAVQNEKYEDWTHTLVELRRLFSDYHRSVLEYNNRANITVPKGINSTAAQGNFLEVLNMSLNVFEKHYLDRSFERTGQLSVVITPGVGVFEVDRELTNVTKQRVIDNGVGSDLVCLGEQPLHAVPLFKFHNKDSSITGDDYSMPHWINLSFYSSNKRVSYSNFIPRIKLPPKRSTMSKSLSHASKSVRPKALHEEEDPLAVNTVDYDAYDSKVFSMPSVQQSKVSRVLKKTSVAGLETTTTKIVRRKMSDPDIHYISGAGLTEHGGSDRSGMSALSKSPAMSIPLARANSDAHFNTSSVLHYNLDFGGRMRTVMSEASETDSPPGRITIGSSESSSGTQQTPIGLPSSFASVVYQPPRGRALINPFDPSHITIKLTSNRRRWTHIFPKGPTGHLIQQHHYQANNNPPSKSFNNSHLNDTVIKEPDVKSKPRHSVLTLSGLFSTQTSSRKSALLWGVTGEQEWTPALTTAAASSKVIIGVDWKSLTIPACLPITTDYFPDDVCLRTDYVFSDYNLLPDDVNADYAQQRIIYWKPLQTNEVFQELISQRLAQGFQVIVDDSGSITTPNASGASVVVSPRASETSQVIEYKLSIGRIFHRITLNGSEIRVTRYRPRHPYPPFNFDYWYRFQAPDHPSYGVSWISFSTEKLENFNWNYFDHYICTRGDTDFSLVETLKYWRFRMFLLPACQSVTKKILDGSSHCDLYSPHTAEEQASLIENFIKFIETWVNKIKRQPNHKKQRLDLTALNETNIMTRRRYSTGIIFPKSSIAGNSPFRERLGSNRLPEKPRPRSGSKVLERAKMSVDSALPPTPSESEHSETDQDTGSVFTLRSDTALPEIVEAMKHPANGLSFLGLVPSLPKFTFVSYDAVQWLINHIDGISNQSLAQAMLQGMVDEKLICHASGDFSIKFVYGFYLYHIIKTHKEDTKGEFEPLGDSQGFENEWAEIEIFPNSLPYSQVPTFLRENLPPSCSQIDQKGPMYKKNHLEIDVQGKSDRVEWGHLKYHSTYRPDRAFELVVQWAAASGAIVADLVFGWARKASSCSLQLIPIPADPFALPYYIKSDPLRGPIFIPLDIESLMENKSYLFEEFDESTWTHRLVLFQEAIALKFGFLACAVESAKHQHNQYIHLSGNVFLLIPSGPCEHSVEMSTSRSKPVRQYSVTAEQSGSASGAAASFTAASPHHEYITRHVGKNVPHADTGVGFLWSWNHMVSRRWKHGPVNVTSDELFQNKLLSNFSDFCSNNDGRLQQFWTSSWLSIR